MTKSADKMQKHGDEHTPPANGHGRHHETHPIETGLTGLIKTVETAVEANPVGGALAAFGVGFVISRLLSVGGKGRD